MNYKSAANNATNNAKINADGTMVAINAPATKRAGAGKKEQSLGFCFTAGKGCLETDRNETEIKLDYQVKL